MIRTLNEHVGIEFRGFFLIGCENASADDDLGIADSREHGRTPVVVISIHVA